jgi:AraC-like DNA-binding protein
MYAVVIVTRGRGHYLDERGFAKDVIAGDLIVVFPDLAHQYGPPPGETWDEIFVAFEGPSFDGWRAAGLDSACPVWFLGSPARWRRHLQQLLHRRIRTRADSCAAVGKLHRLIAEWLSLREIKAAPVWLDAARHDLADPTRGQNLGAIATVAGLSIDSFRREFRAATGDPPARFRLRQRIAAGASLLCRRDLRLKQIAQILNFYDEFHFSKVFKKHYGESPQSYRENVTEPGMAKFNPLVRTIIGHPRPK